MAGEYERVPSQCDYRCHHRIVLSVSFEGLGHVHAVPRSGLGCGFRLFGLGLGAPNPHLGFCIVLFVLA